MSFLRFLSLKPFKADSLTQHLWSCAKVVLGINSVGFVLTALTGTHKLTDLLGTGAFVVVSWHSHVRSCSAMGIPIFRPTSSLLLTSCVSLWGTRLASFLFYRILKTGHDDRFSGFFPKGDEAWLIGPSIFPLKLAGFWSLQALWPMVVLLPVFVSQKLNPSFKMTSRRLIPFCGFLLGFLWETIADVQKLIRKSKPGLKDRWIQTGLYRYSRYPNYFGEIMIWASICALASNSRVIKRAPWIVISPIFVYALLMYVSGVPITEASREEKYGGDLLYLAYKEATNLIFPWWPKRTIY